METLNNKNNKQFVLKSGVLLLGVAILSACQMIGDKPNVSNHGKVLSNQPIDKSDTAKQPLLNFNKFGSVQEQDAKQQLTAGMHALLGRERTAITEYYYQVHGTQTDKSNLNTGSDGLFSTILKVFGYEKEEEQKGDDITTPFRTMADYTPLSETDNELYLRYYDEIDGTLPAADYRLKRLDGMSERMQATDTVVYQLNKGYQSCVQALSYEIDGLVEGNPAVTSDDKVFKSALATFDACTKEQDITANRLRGKDISAYHRQDIAMGHVCASNYRRSLLDALHPNRTIKRYDKKDGNYDAYDSVYGQYGICHSVFMNGYRSDPVVYMNNGDSKVRLEGLKSARACGLEFSDGVIALYQAGMGYRTHAKEQQGLVYAHMDCLMDSAEKLYNEDGEYTYALSTYETPTNRTQMAEALKLYQEMASHERSSAYEEPSSSRRWGGFFDKYFAMKKAELEKKSDKADNQSQLDGLGSNVYGRVAGEFIKNIAQTSEQVSATNYYAYNNTKVSILSHHRPKAYRSDVLISIDFESPTAVQSVQLPLSSDYKAGKFAVDANALLPVMAVLAPNQTPLAKEFKGQVGVMNFAMPKDLQGVIPTDLVYDAIIRGFVVGLGSLHDSNFNKVDISQDSFAKKQGATSAVKLTLNLQQSGELLGFISKQVIKELSDYVEKNPKVYEKVPTDNLGVADSLATQAKNEKKQKIKTAIEQWALLDKGFISSDVGGLFQIIDGVLPIDYYQSNYYYFDAQGQLVGQVVRQDLDDNLSKIRTKTLSSTSFKTADFNTHHLAKKVLPLVDTFSFDGNAWIGDQKKTNDLQKDAQLLRYGYDSGESVLDTEKK